LFSEENTEASEQSFAHEEEYSFSGEEAGETSPITENSEETYNHENALVEEEHAFVGSSEEAGETTPITENSEEANHGRVLAEEEHAFVRSSEEAGETASATENAEEANQESVLAEEEHAFARSSEEAGETASATENAEEANQESVVAEEEYAFVRPEYRRSNAMIFHEELSMENAEGSEYNVNEESGETMLFELLKPLVFSAVRDLQNGNGFESNDVETNIVNLESVNQTRSISWSEIAALGVVGLVIMAVVLKGVNGSRKNERAYEDSSLNYIQVKDD